MKEHQIKLVIEGIDGKEPDAKVVADMIKRFAELYECVDRSMNNGKQTSTLRIVSLEMAE